MSTRSQYLLTRSGHTLTELMVAMLSASALMIGLASAILVSVKATDTGNASITAIADGSEALSEMLSELEFAISFSEKTATAITFTVPDRDGNDAPETIRYAWPGTPGDALTREYNGSAPAALVENVHGFQHDLSPTGPYSRITIRLQIGSNSNSMVRSGLALLNLPS